MGEGAANTEITFGNSPQDCDVADAGLLCALFIPDWLIDWWGCSGSTVNWKRDPSRLNIYRSLSQSRFSIAPLMHVFPRSVVKGEKVGNDFFYYSPTPKPPISHPIIIPCLLFLFCDWQTHIWKFVCVKFFIYLCAIVTYHHLINVIYRHRHYWSSRHQEPFVDSVTVI